jgi:hypothetical protein
MNNAQWWANRLAAQQPQVQQGRPDPTPPMPPSPAGWWPTAWAGRPATASACSRPR